MLQLLKKYNCEGWVLSIKQRPLIDAETFVRSACVESSGPSRPIPFIAVTAWTQSLFCPA